MRAPTRQPTCTGPPTTGGTWPGCSPAGRWPRRRVPEPEVMTDDERLSLAEWLVLCLVREDPTYGRVLVGLLARDGPVGQVWSVPKAVVYRALPRLEALGLIRTVGEQRTSQGPVRSLYQATPAGEAAAIAWLRTPVQHPRDIRSELMVKLALLDRSGTDSQDLLRAQLARLLPVAAALEDRLRATTGFEHTLVLWRHEAMAATLRFLQTLAVQDEVRTS